MQKMYAVRLMNFKIKGSSTKIEDHIYVFDNLVIDLHNFVHAISDEKKRPTSFELTTCFILVFVLFQCD